MASSWLTSALSGASRHPKRPEHSYSYGTAGFRTKADILEPVLYRVGLLAVLRSKAVKGSTIGVMITASHNPEADNGVKVVEPMGDMLLAQWETYATSLANAREDDLESVLQDIISKENIDMEQSANVFVARDTRPSSVSLAEVLIEGIQSLSGQYVNYGLLSTPQLHYMVRCHNTQGSYGKSTETGYYEKLTNAFTKLRQKNGGNGKGSYSNQILLDGANGVGALKVEQLKEHLKGQLDIIVNNDGSKGKLNEECGADYVKIQQRPPPEMDVKPETKCVSFDGDADRIVYFYMGKGGKFKLLDGDKIATLIAGYIQELLTEAGIQLTLGLIQTAYANGSSTHYATKMLNVPIACTRTGVKHLHHKAQEFEVGVYFEANGHGTVLFSPSVIPKLDDVCQDKSLSAGKKEAATKLRLLVDLINETVGDAISDLLVVETILYQKQWNIEEWNSSYTDLPNRQLKVKVKDRAVIQTTDAERKTTSPAGLQSAIDELVAQYNKARSFVRPSGTEDVVRVYAEADTQIAADELAAKVGVKVHELAQGVGDPPSLPS
ncbi:phosphoacetylglucosamine mutase-like [Amphiura filiformis]|uniref:phosphoacetylglucosamine mutase-like n=1 Tax=Amphiura filiformis TaxID=82378 RepID=UPI003B20E2D6